MVKMAVLRAWAELQVSSKEQRYLVDVVKPHISTLAPLWLSSLREFARLRFEPDVSTNSTGPTALGGSIDTIYSALNRETLLQVCKFFFVLQYPYQSANLSNRAVCSFTKTHG
jgi:hypothetical protein